MVMTETDAGAASSERDIRSYGRIKSRAFSKARETLMAEDFPRYRLSDDALPDIPSLAEGREGLFLEIGFGNGGHMIACARNHPEYMYIGAEPFLNGVGAAAAAVKEHDLSNVRIYNGDSRHILRTVPAELFDGIYILFPDPWPKTRHHKKRLLQQPFLSLAAQKITPGGRMLIATDHEDYAAFVAEELDKTEELTRINEDIFAEPPEWTQTKYQRKALKEGREAQFFDMRRLSSAR